MFTSMKSSCLVKLLANALHGNPLSRPPSVEYGGKSLASGREDTSTSKKSSYLVKLPANACDDPSSRPLSVESGGSH